MDFSTAGTLTAIEAGITGVWALVISYSLSVVGAVVLLTVGWTGARLVERALLGSLSSIRGFDATLSRFLASLARYAILVLVIVMVLGQFGVQTASIIAAIGAAGLAIGLALQGTLQNIAAGLMLLFLRPFRIGEAIEVGSLAGDVEEIGLFATKLRAGDGAYILAPNSKLWNEPIRNTSRNRVRRNEIAVNIAYPHDFEEARRILVGLAEADKRVRRQPAPIAYISAVAENFLTVSLRYWTSEADFFRTRVDLTSLGLLTLKERGIGHPTLLDQAEGDGAPVASLDREEERRVTRQ